MATVPNKDGQDQFTDTHVYTPREVLSAKVNAAIKPPAGNSSAAKPPLAPA